MVKAERRWGAASIVVPYRGKPQINVAKTILIMDCGRKHTSSMSPDSLAAMSEDLFSLGGIDLPATPKTTVERYSIVTGNGSVGRLNSGFDKIVATDGACSGNPGPGGWAFVEQISGDHASGGAARTTNNIMELTALICALEYAGPECSLLIRSDSQYSLNVMTQWAAGWRRRGWKKADKKPVKNRELVQRLLELYESRTGRTEVEWVKGHAGDEANELCDRLAVEQARRYAQ